MNYLAWRPTGNTHIIPIRSIHTQALVLIQALAPGTTGQAMRLCLTQQMCPQVEQLELEDPRTATASKTILGTQEVLEAVEMEMGAHQLHRQKNPLEEAKFPHQTPVNTCRALEAIAIIWPQEIIPPSI